MTPARLRKLAAVEADELRPVPWRCRVCNVEGECADYELARRAWQRHYNTSHLRPEPAPRVRLTPRGEAVCVAVVAVLGFAAGFASGPYALAWPS